MKKVLLLIICVSVTGFLNTGFTFKASDRQKGPVMKFDNLVHDFGTIKEGDVVSFVFAFTNTGNEPLIIEDVEKVCGCTTSSWNKAPIMPGKTGEITVKFDSGERPGFFRKTMTIKTNMQANPSDPLMLMIRGNVLTKKQWKAQANSTSRK